MSIKLSNENIEKENRMVKIVSMNFKDEYMLKSISPFQSKTQVKKSFQLIEVILWEKEET